MPSSPSGARAAPEHPGPCQRYVEMTTAVLRSGRADLVAALVEGRLTVRAAYFAVRPAQEVGLHLLRRGWAKATPAERARVVR